MAEITERFVDSSDGVRIAVYEEGNPDGPTLVLVHGWPDSHVLWDGVVPLLADRFRIVRYDNRGVGKSSVPKPISAYTMARYADDFAAVIDAVAPGEPVHVLAHDWGSAGMWEYLARPGASDRVASFTSVSGPERRSPRTASSSAASSGRIGRGGFCRHSTSCCGSPTWACSPYRCSRRCSCVRFLADGLTRLLMRRDGIPADQLYHSDDLQDRCRQQSEGVPRELLPHDRSRARTDHYVDVPVQLIVNAKDPFVRPLRLRRHPQLGAAAVAPRHQGRPLVADVAPAGDRAIGRANSSTSSRASRRAGRCCARRSAVSANTSATRWFP